MTKEIEKFVVVCIDDGSYVERAILSHPRMVGEMTVNTKVFSLEEATLMSLDEAIEALAQIERGDWEIYRVSLKITGVL